MLWGCNTETQDPVSSKSASTGSAPVKVLYKTISSPTNGKASVMGTTVAVSWGSVTFAVDYHVVVHANGNPYVDTILYAQQFVLTKVPAGSYTVTVATILPGLSEGTASAPASFSLSSVAAPTVTAMASHFPFWFRNNEWVTVTFSGLVVNSQGEQAHVDT